MIASAITILEAIFTWWAVDDIWGERNSVWRDILLVVHQAYHRAYSKQLFAVAECKRNKVAEYINECRTYSFNSEPNPANSGNCKRGGSYDLLGKSAS